MKFPKFGQGTWFLGENPRTYAEEKAALIAAYEGGINLIDTAELYGAGNSETLVGDVLKDIKRDDIFVVSKVIPSNAGEKRIFSACEASLKRLGIEALDCYLLHWRGDIPLQETIDCMESLKQQGKIKSWGVSNFDTEDLAELINLRDGEKCCTNQVLYHLGSRGIEYDLLPFMQEKNIALMAYCPLAQAGRLRSQLLAHPSLIAIAKQKGITVFQVLLSFLNTQKGVVPIPRSSKVAHAKENAEAKDYRLTSEELNILNQAFPSPTHKMPLDFE